MNQATKDMVRTVISGFISHIDAIKNRVDLQYSTLIKKEENKSDVVSGDNRITIIYNPMTNFCASQWDKTKLIMHNNKTNTHTPENMIPIIKPKTIYTQNTQNTNKHK